MTLDRLYVEFEYLDRQGIWDRFILTPSSMCKVEVKIQAYMRRNDNKRLWDYYFLI